ncbi:MAG TPA: hypothetical protein VIL85_17465, partial [Thermomicrobiales bacterium]
MSLWAIVAAAAIRYGCPCSAGDHAPGGGVRGDGGRGTMIETATVAERAQGGVADRGDDPKPRFGFGA